MNERITLYPESQPGHRWFDKRTDPAAMIPTEPLLSDEKISDKSNNDYDTANSATYDEMAYGATFEAGCRWARDLYEADRVEKDKLIRQLVNVLALPVFSMNANMEDLEQTKKALEKAKQMGFEPLYP